MRLRRRSSAHTEEHTDGPADDDTPMPTEESAHAGPPPRRILRATRIDDSSSGEHVEQVEQVDNIESVEHVEAAPDPAMTAGDQQDAHEPVGGAGEVSGAPSPPPTPARSSKGRIRALFDERVAQSREEAERQAAEELQAFMEPARQQLLLNVPGSSSPEEAEAMLNSQAAGVLASPVPAQPDEVVDLRNTSAMGAYPPAAQLSNRVLRLADRHWAKPKVRPSADIVAEMAAIAEQDFARKPAGTQRCFALRGSLRCRGVFAYRSDEQDDAAVLSCPACGSAHQWDTDRGEWTLAPESALSAASARGSLSSGS